MPDAIPVNIAIKAMDACPKVKEKLKLGVSASDIVASLEDDVKTALTSFVSLFGGAGTTLESFFATLLAGINFHPMTPEEEQRWWDRAQGTDGAG